MLDSSLVRLLAAQTDGAVGLMSLDAVASGPGAVAAAFAQARAEGVRYVVADALCDAHLDTLATATRGLGLSTGAAGLAAALGRALAPGARRLPHPVPGVEGAAAIVAGSASTQTRRQIERFAAHGETYLVDPRRGSRDDLVSNALSWAKDRVGSSPILIAVDSAPGAVAELQEKLGTIGAGAFVEDVLAEIASGLVALGVRRLLVAGGETSGSVMARLGIRSLVVGESIAVGVPWTYAAGPMAIALKSGNFGGDDLFVDAFEKLSAPTGARR
jgi:uncharacterized protein YgbK (DUF1537 family)